MSTSTLVYPIRAIASGKHLVNTLADLQAYSVAFVSLRDNLDLSKPSGRLMSHVVASVAEFERANSRASDRRHPG